VTRGSAMIKSYEDLDVWQRAMQLVEKIYRLTENFPRKEQYRLVDQLCRAAVSVPSNIAEGSMRHTTKEYIRFVGIAQGSLAEVETQVMIAHRLGYLELGIFDDAIQTARNVGKMLNALSQALIRKVQASDILHESPVRATSTS
jgi:four helix bundle protein